MRQSAAGAGGDFPGPDFSRAGGLGQAGFCSCGKAKPDVLLVNNGKAARACELNTVNDLQVVVPERLYRLVYLDDSL
jgi:hypothetical protein